LHISQLDEILRFGTGAAGPGLLKKDISMIQEHMQLLYSATSSGLSGVQSDINRLQAVRRRFLHSSVEPRAAK
jgi:hypothetical protein